MNIKIAQTIRIPTKSQILLTKYPIKIESESPIKIESESAVKKEVLIKKSEQNISYINRNDPTIESTIPIKPVIFPIKLKSESPVEMIESIIQKDPTIESSISKKLSEFKSKIH